MSAVLVIGATGKTGSALLDLLRARAEPVRAASRTPKGEDAVRFDWDDTTTHGPALDGVDRVYLVPPPSAVDPVPVVEPFLAEARRRGIRRLVMLGSAIEFPHAPGRLELAARVRAEPGVACLEPLRVHAELSAPASGRHGHPRPRGDRERSRVRADGLDRRSGRGCERRSRPHPAASRRAATQRLRAHRTTCPELHRRSHLHRHAGRRSVHVRDLTVDELAARYRAAGLPAGFAGSLAAIGDDVRAGRYDEVTTSVLNLTGRPPRTFEDFVGEHAAEWQPSR